MRWHFVVKSHKKAQGLIDIYGKINIIVFLNLEHRAHECLYHTVIKVFAQ